MDNEKSCTVKKKSKSRNVYIPPPARKLSEDARPNTSERVTSCRSNAYDGSKACNDSSKLFMNDNERVYSVEWTKHRQRTKKKQTKVKSKSIADKCSSNIDNTDELSTKVINHNTEITDNDNPTDISSLTDNTADMCSLNDNTADMCSLIDNTADICSLTDNIIDDEVSAKNIDEQLISNECNRIVINDTIKHVDKLNLDDEKSEDLGRDDELSQIMTVTFSNTKLDQSTPPTIHSQDSQTSDSQDWETLYDHQSDNEHFKEILEESKKKKVKAEEKNDKEDIENRGSILEIYGFPKDLKTNDLVTVLSAYTTRGLKLSWVDDTHALAIFPSPSLADEVLACELPLIKTRPLVHATQASQDKAKTLVLPSTLRPKTCSAMARRLVSGALGLKVSITPEAREAEREILRKAREEKKLAAKQRDAAWEGVFDVTKNN